MLYNPWRAIVQLVGSLMVLAIIDWRLLLGSLVLLPEMFAKLRIKPFIPSRIEVELVAHGDGALPQRDTSFAAERE